MDRRISIIILAAGAAKRMGSPKQLLQLRSGLSLLQNSLNEAKHAAPTSETILVLGSNFAEIQRHIQQGKIQPTRTICNHDWSSGLSSSIICGLEEALRSEEKPTAVLIMLADQPLIDRTYLREMLQLSAQQPHRIVATGYPFKGDSHKAGVPAIFPAAQFHRLKELKGDKGAKEMLASANPLLLPAGKRTFDIDRPEDFAAFKRIQTDKPEQ